MDLDDAVNDIYFMMGSGFFGLKYTSLHGISKIKPLIGTIRDEIEIKKEDLLNQAYELSKKVISDNLDYIEKLMDVYKKNNYIEMEDAISILKK